MPEHPSAVATVGGYALGFAATAWVLHSKARDFDRTASDLTQILAQHELQTAQLPPQQPE